ncbi:MAG TPA: hypothetical protein VK620_20085 [Bradyrhizobium sp.]|nr:hypothetical protein [Bradyrhizobium sp.]
MSLRPHPGFNWMLVAWDGPDEPRTDQCSYCGDKFPDEDEDPEFVPLILWNSKGWAAEFCDHCQTTWFGIQSFPEPVKPRKEAS